MGSRHLEITQETYDNFMKLKASIEEMAGEAVSEDEVVDFMIRSLMSSIELPEEEHDHEAGCCCCGGH